jgi:hypothetical protein
MCSNCPYKIVATSEEPAENALFFFGASLFNVENFGERNSYGFHRSGIDRAQLANESFRRHRAYLKSIAG